MKGIAGRGVAALLMCGMGLSPAWAQDAVPEPARAPSGEPPPPIDADATVESDVDVDVEAPLAPLPELDLPWPEIEGAEGDPVFAPLAELIEGEAEEEGSEAQLFETDLRDYDWTLVGLPEAVAGEIEEEFEALSALAAGDGEADNAAQIDRRAKTDVALLEQILDAKGYHAATIALDYVPQGAELLVRFEVEPDAQFVFTEVQLPGLAATGENEAALREAFGVEVGDPVRAAEVIAGTADLLTALGERGYPQAELGERQVIIDYDSATATLLQPVEAGPLAVYGEIRVEGEPPFPARHVARLARFAPGEIYDRSEIVDLRRALIATGLVSSVVIETEPRAGGEVVDVAVTLQPAKLRTIAGEVGYGTGEGFRIEGQWQHRNFWNPEGALTLDGVLGTQEQLAAATLLRSNWLRRDQRLSMQLLASSIRRDAYEADLAQATVRVERVSDFLWQKEFTWGAGIELFASSELDRDPDLGLERRRAFYIGALPLVAEIDQSNDLLDPTRGWTLEGFVSPEINLNNNGDTYVRASVKGTLFRPFGEKVVAAAKVKVGTIAGTSRDAVAPTRRWYAGGGGSVRGYGFQALGPRDIFGDPIGGRSLSEFALEARVRVWGPFAVVPFFDGGRVGEEPWPGTSDWQFGTGIGLRYHSNFGPIRVDVGTPLNPREGDSPVAVVVGLGQAF
ncbi:autotransporter assembly complex protein TamA [Sphingomicrobium astaxanthinifaciens]|uniref:autotransporter assembly complex protein TamA n=1 Tax=Sphingomicrobium astaxanthinifaciens TaxID=1227949 RepID=UPI001FCB8F82|nr:BamA/TamA family outer membrane protein [Sphingomicrobium astaxanthinifaciens]MCJ7420545.1 BamA/TamA family outer membrane protein [Sphingomicrobium astaxanthinifaciens]